MISDTEILAEPTPKPEVINPQERVRLGGDEYAICAVIGLSPDVHGNNPDVSIAVLDVGFRQNNGKFGPYDIDGTGVKRTFDKPYVMVRREITEAGPQTHVFEFGIGEPVVIGRDYHNATREALSLKNESRISRDHARVTTDKYGFVRVEDLGSSNGTKTKSGDALVGLVSTEFGYTFNINKAVSAAGQGHRLVGKESKAGWGHGEYAGRPKIARDTPINGGVYPVGGTHGEALVIDDEKYPKELDQVYDKVLETLATVEPTRISLDAIKSWAKIRKGSETSDDSLTQHTLEEVLSVVENTLKYNLAATNRIASDYQKVSLNTYIHEGVGVCRTQAALSAYVIERLIKDGRMNGQVSIDRNLDHDVAGGHAWARYRSADGQVYIIDPAQHYVGTIESTYGTSKWDYRRSEDIMKVILA